MADSVVFVTKFQARRNEEEPAEEPCLLKLSLLRFLLFFAAAAFAGELKLEEEVEPTSYS